MKYIISKEFSFEAAHRLNKNYTGKCTNNHGHSWLVRVSIEAETLDNKDMVIDFQDTKVLKQWIDEKLDHATILWEHDPMCQYIRDTGQRLFVTSKNPTSEHLAEIILEKAQQFFDKGNTRVHCIELNETCTNGAKLFP
ncbi:MAG TPA: 6-carboxytetrahydropterin synthase [Bacteroidales bacterium]|nr:6-carboxytetrahydropterin synthase [Bacteroidales bacterium]